jgi:hypothetical protein
LITVKAGAPAITVAMKQIARSTARRILVVIFRAFGWNVNPHCASASRIGAAACRSVGGEPTASRRFPLASVVAVCSYWLTGFSITTIARSTAAPDRSFTTPSVFPEDCDRGEIPPNHKLNVNIENPRTRKLFKLIFSVPNGSHGVI